VPSWSDDPTFVLSVIKTNAAATADRNPRLHSETGQRTREELEKRILFLLRPSARAPFRKYRDWLQKYARARERSKACWVRSIRLSRPVLLEMARRCQERGIISSEGDFWYLTFPEMAAIFAGQRESSYGQRVASRRAEQLRLQTMNLPEVFEAPPQLVPTEAAAPAAALSGLGVSRGQAAGRARVITSAAAAEESELLPGEVLVAPFTDAAWTPLFVSAAGVVVETGGMLSHAATVAREYGIPAVVAVRGATVRIRDGDLVTLDGSAGTVRIG